ncbi:MAG: amidase [Bacteroidales bacterium]|nr:amidase [Bacteroidales bacterium]
MKSLSKLYLLLFFVFSGFLLSSCKEQAKEKTPVYVNVEELTINQFEKGIKEKKFTIRQVVESYLHRIKTLDQSGPRVNSIIEVNPEALNIADSLDKLLAEGKEFGSLFGVPVLLKDNIDTHDKMSTTAGSRALAGSHPLTDSWVAEKLRQSGAIILGKANLSEWANFRCSYSSSGWSGVGGQTNNPYILDRNPCGSSSGPGAAVSANFALFGIGTETNGSIVCPSSTNGLVGIKPTVGLISRSGVVPISFTQDTPGPMARTVTDAAIALGTMVGVDPSDSKTEASKGHYYTDYTQFLKIGSLKGKRIGLYRAPLGRNYKVDTLVYRAVRYLKSQGAEVVEINNILQPKVGAASFQVLLYEFKDGLNKYFKSLGPHAPVKSLKDVIAFNKTDSVELEYFDQKLMLEAEAKGDLNSPEYKKDLKIMTEGSRKNGIDKVMDQYKLDAIIAPTGGPAWKTDLVNGDNFSVSSSSPAAIAGYPNITVPMGSIDGLPVGLSFFGKAWSEPQLIELAYSYEQGTHYRRTPQFITTDVH